MTIIVLNPIEVRRAIWKILDKPMPETVSPGLLGASVGILGEALTQYGERMLQDVKSGVMKTERVNLTDDNRHAVLGFLFTPDTHGWQDGFYHALNDHQKYALWRWVKPVKIDDRWLPREGFITEARWVLNEAKKIRTTYALAHWGTEQTPPTMNEYLQALADKLQEQDLFSTIDDGGVIAEGLKHGGQIAMVLDDNNPTGQPLCDWCGDVPGWPDEPCESCKNLGAKPENNPKRKAWPKRPEIKIVPALSAQVLADMEHCKGMLDKLKGEAMFSDANAANLLVAYEELAQCQAQGREISQDALDSFTFRFAQYKRVEALY